jgi:flagellar protein FliO/FliZ
MLELTIRLVFSLAVVIGLLLLLARLSSRRFRGQSDAMVRVLHRQPISRHNAVTVVAVGSRILVLGTTEHEVRVLTELDPEELEETVTLPSLPPVRPRGAHRAETPVITTASPKGRLGGSVLSPATWKQAIAAVTGRSS